MSDTARSTTALNRSLELCSVARRLKARIDAGDDSFEAMNACQDHMIALANANAERVVYDAFRAKVDACEDPQMRELLASLLTLYSLDAIERGRGWFLESGYIEAAKSKAIRKEMLALCAELAPMAVGLVDGFGIPDALIRAPVAEPEAA